jgi:hypothetical protein
VQSLKNKTFIELDSLLEISLVSFMVVIVQPVSNAYSLMILDPKSSTDIQKKFMFAMPFKNTLVDLFMISHYLLETVIARIAEE